MSGAEKFHGTTLISAEDGAVSSHRVTGMGRPGRPGPLVKWRSRSVCKGFHCPLSLAGIPPFAGFFSKFFVFAAAFSGGFHLLVFIALVNTVVSLYYYLLIVKAMYIMPGDAPIAAFRSDRYTRVSLALCMAGVLLLGIVSAVYDGINAFAFGL